MVHTRFMSSVLWLLFVLNALRGYSCTHPHQDFEMEQSNLVVNEDNVKGFLDGLSTTRTRKVWFGGRKMVVKKEIEKDEISGANCYDMIKCERNFNVKYWKVEDSPLKKFNKKIGFVAFGDDYHGEENNAFVKSLQGSQHKYFNHQKNMNNLKKPATLGIPKSEATVQVSNPKHTPQNSKKLPTKASLESLSRSQKLFSHHHSDDQESQSTTTTKGETQKLLEATKEIVNLMNKDYKGMDRPRRKPPINNHVPIH